MLSDFVATNLLSLFILLGQVTQPVQVIIFLSCKGICLVKITLKPCQLPTCMSSVIGTLFLHLSHRLCYIIFPFFQFALKVSIS